MKKILFATTALVATAGVAAADVTFDGYGRFGVIHSDRDGRAPGATSTNDLLAQQQARANLANTIADPNATSEDVSNAASALSDADADVTSSSARPAGSDVDITSRFRLQINATAESDMGVTFGARARIQQEERGAALGVTDAVDDAANSGTGINGVRFFARSGGLEVGVGNIFGALESMKGQYPIDLGLTGLGYQYTAYGFNGDLYSSDGAGAAGSNGVEVIYSMGDLKVHVSASDNSDRVAGHVAYTFSGFTFELGGQDSDRAGDTDVTAAVSGSFAGANVSFSYADNGTNGDRFVLAGDYAVGAATTLQAYIADQEGASNDTGYGIGVHHDLGGGTSIRGGYASFFNGDSRADLGVRFNF